MDQVDLYNELAWDAQLQGGTDPDQSVIVDGLVVGMVKHDRVVLLFDEDRVAELVAQHRGAVYQGNDSRDWLVVDPGVDESTFCELFSDATAERTGPRAAIDRFMKRIAAEVRALPEQSGPDWDTYSMVAEVSEGSVRVNAFCYPTSGPAVPTDAPENDRLFRDLHGKTFAADGKPWDVLVVKIRREPANVQLSFWSGRAADEWRVNPENTASVAEWLRWPPAGPNNDPPANLAELSQEIAADLLTLPELSGDPDWDTLSVVAEVTDDSVTVSVYRYSESGPPVPTEAPGNLDVYWKLHETTRGTDGETWDVVIVKMHRDTASLAMEFVSGEAAEMWHVTPQNYRAVQELLRPRPEDFPALDGVDGTGKPVGSQPGPAPSEVPQQPAPVHWNQDANIVLGDRLDCKQTDAAWPEVRQHRHAVWAGGAVDGGNGLLVRAYGFDPVSAVVSYEAIGLVRMSQVAQRPDRGFQARLEAVPLGPAGELDGVVDREELRDLLRRAADRDPLFAAGWEQPRMRPALPTPSEVADLAFRDVGEDLLRRLAMPLSTRIELLTRPERQRLQILVDQLREVADGAPPPPETAQRLDRPLVDLPPHGVPVAYAQIWLTPGAVSTIRTSALVCDQALAEGWLAITTDLTVGRAVMATHPLRRSEAADADGWYALTTDQVRPAIIRAVVPGEAGSSLLELAPAPSATEAAYQGLPEPGGERERLTAYVELLRRAYARDKRVVGAASGCAYRLWQAGRFTSLRALMSWQIGQLGFGAQAVLDLQAIAWPDRLIALTLVLQGVAAGRPLAEMAVEGAGAAAAALLRT